MRTKGLRSEAKHNLSQVGMLQVTCIADIMAQAGYCSESWFLSLTSRRCTKEKRSQYSKMYLAYRLQEKQCVLNILQRMEQSWQRCCLMSELRTCLAQYLQLLLPESGHKHMHSTSISRIYDKHLHFKLKKAEEEAKEHPNARTIVYQYVESCVFRGSKASQKKYEKKIVEGRILSRRFIALTDAENGFKFQNTWMQIQKEALHWKAPEKTTMLFECGTNESGTLKKWVLDIDAPIAELEKEGLIGEDLDAGIKDMGIWLCGLFRSKMKVLTGTAYFSIVTRHTEKKKSWHLTLNILGDHETWRNALKTLNKSVATFKAMDTLEKKLFKYIDPSILNNSKCQYMQVIFSTKIVENAPGPYQSYFQWYGMFDEKGDRVSVVDHDELSQAVVTSMMFQDPWSLPMKKIIIIRIQEPALRKVVRDTKIRKVDSEMDRLAERERVFGMEWPLPWMREFFIAQESQITTIPAMSLAKNIPDAIQTLVIQKRCKIVTHAYIIKPRLCPRQFVVNRKKVQHGSNKCVVICTEESHHRCPGVSDFRMFGLCLSEKCKEKKCRNPWVEIQEIDAKLLFRDMFGIEEETNGDGVA